MFMETTNTTDDLEFELIKARQEIRGLKYEIELLNKRIYELNWEVSELEDEAGF